MIKRIKEVLCLAIDTFKQLKLFVRIFILLIVVGAIFSAVAITVTGTTQFCNSCHVMNPYYDSWKSSTHSEVNCLKCHLQPGFEGYIKGKINGLAQAVDCAVGRVSTKLNSTIEDASCLREGCHSVEEIESKSILYNDIKFTHKGHVSKTIDGIKISCVTCHSHFEGDEHFGVNSRVCFSCHFLKAPQSADKAVQTSCRDCHEVPTKVIQHGSVEINHSEFVSDKTSCEDSCHKQQVIQLSEVDNISCLNCHSFTKEHLQSSHQLHEIHTTGEKVECFACHGEVTHGSTESAVYNTTVSQKTTSKSTSKSTPKPTVLSKSCSSEGCHDTFLDMEYGHGPVLIGECHDCHEPLEVEKHTFEFVRKGKKLCEFCHTEQSAKKHVHALLKIGDCLQCHDAHGSNYPSILLKPADQICSDCHNVAEGAELRCASAEDENNCLGCHDAHGGDDSRMLKAKVPQLCYPCHEEIQKTIEESTVPDNILSKEDGCLQCHTPHISTVKFALSDTPAAICQSCHDKTSQADKTDVLTDFRNGNLNLHFLHVNKEHGGVACKSCHTTYTGNQAGHIHKHISGGRWEFIEGFTKIETGGNCKPGCHLPRAYDRKKPVNNSTTLSENKL